MVYLNSSILLHFSQVVMNININLYSSDVSIYSNVNIIINTSKWCATCQHGIIKVGRRKVEVIYVE